jgi:hypothetical protein
MVLAMLLVFFAPKPIPGVFVSTHWAIKDGPASCLVFPDGRGLGRRLYYRQMGYVVLTYMKTAPYP